MFEDDDNDSFAKLMKKYDVTVKKNVYSQQFNNFYDNRKEYDEYIENKIYMYLTEKLNEHNKIDINEIISNFEYLLNRRINDIFDEIGIKEIVDINKTKGNNKRQIYNEILYRSLFLSKRKNQNHNEFVTYFSDNIEYISIESLSKLSLVLERAEYFSLKNNKIICEEIKNLKMMISELFDESKNINKLIKYVQENYINENENNYSYELTTNKKNIKYLINNMKCSGYLFFKNYLIFLQNKYSHSSNIESINKDKKLVNYFIFIIKDSKTSTSIIINKLLLNIKMYLDDTEDSYYNMMNYKKIDIRVCSDKYKNIKVDELKRNNVNFNIARSIFTNNKNDEFNMPSDITIYKNILESYYGSRYLDRKLYVDNYESTVKIKLNFGIKSYTLEMNMFQYSILKLMHISSNINLSKIIEKTGMDINLIEKIINEFLELELIKRTNERIDETKFTINKNFCHENNNLNITQKIIAKNLKNDSLFEKNKIIYCVLIDLLKKSEQLSFGTIYSEVSKKLPFNVEIGEIYNEINKGIDIEDINEEPPKDTCPYKMYRFIV
jgi:hypothetical protein